VLPADHTGKTLCLVESADSRVNRVLDESAKAMKPKVEELLQAENIGNVLEFRVRLSGQ
jgi:hypothetical protein